MNSIAGKISNSLKKTLASSIVLMGMLFGVVACSNVASVLNLDSDLELNVVAKDDMNPDESEAASPLVVRLYELKDKKKFNELEFFDIYQNDKKLLGKNLIDKHVLKRYVPDSERRNQIILNKKTRFIALFAEFSQYKDADYKAVVEITPHLDRRVNVVLTGTSLQVDHDKREPLFELDQEEDEFNKGVKDAKSATDSLQGLK